MIDIVSAKKVYAEQIEAFNWFIDECFSSLPNMDSSLVRFGGGTALAIYYFRHRRSFDIDLFVTDPQVMSYLSPKLWIDDSKYFKTSEYIDQPNHIRVLAKNGIKIDILVSGDFIDKPYIDESKTLFAQTIFVESIEDILAKKIRYRRNDNKTRDIIDLGVAITKNAGTLKELLAKGAVTVNDIVELRDSLVLLDIAEYGDEIYIVEPFGEYLEAAIKAPDMIIYMCDKSLEEIPYTA